MKKEILALLFWLILPHTSFALNSGTETNGGDGFVADFLRVADSTFRELESKPLSDTERVQLQKLKNQRWNLDVVSSPSVSLNGKDLSAINNPSFSPPKITISQKYWNKFSDEQKAQLVLHEMLPIVGYPDQDYKLSGALMIKLLQSTQDLSTIYDLVETCSYLQIDRFDIYSLKNAKHLNHLIHSAAVKGCQPFIKKAIEAGWNVDYCWKGQTAYQNLKRSAYTFDDKFFINLSTLDFLVSLGANPEKVCL
ncbi:hypothetical protein [Bdellovibrio svalbardensis]|uniref:Ankyrin repeat domain-containing protein n=1 Tax=Bdellovibrio svalbardensis TaxID=2972972 RepID=A0ABT6DG28_9BACT|nr:hypothetical protein [Bdellovibrio svalbardensis]MDG0815804.1 hypothetical protein [Bdellovibrio svalbardensis]